VNQLESKVAILTGASPNIGGTLARGLAAEGARVLCTDLDLRVAQSCADKIVADGGDAIAVAGDVTDEAHAADVVAQAVQRWGRLDILVNNAVMFHQQGLFDMPLATYRRQLDIILGGAFLLTRSAARAMIEAGNGGSVINILSTAAWQGQPGNIGYTTAKSGLINFTRSAAMELAEYGIRVNGLTPTATQPADPEVARRAAEIIAQPSQWSMDFTGQFPMRRLPTTSDYVGAAVFLASEASAMITGSNITVDGGATAKYWPWVPHAGAE
jgi:NAD(P)-dependent dehydrogenase (short-subunit alcohol dehydrogenase family)